MDDCIQVTLTTASEESADRLARSAVEARLAACAQVAGPIRSTFRWQGTVKSKIEWQCYYKTTASCYDALESHILEHYPADTPEITAVPIVLGSRDYRTWIGTETRDE